MRFKKLFCLLFVIGCTMGPDYNKPDIEIPKTWQKSGVFKEGDMRFSKWWKIFNDDSLDSLMLIATENNKDLKIAQSRLTQAELSVGVSKSVLYPSLNTTGYAKRSRLSETLNPDANGRTSNLYGLDLEASWELDLWGKNRRQLEASNALLEGAKASYQDIMVSLYAEIATNYVNLRTLEKRLEVSLKSVDSRRQTLDIVEKKYVAQLVSELDIHQANQNLASSEANIPVLKASIDRTKNYLTFLTGLNLGSLDDLLVATYEIPQNMEEIEVNIPTEALRQRPDIRRAEMDLWEKTAMVGVKKADLLPTFSLSGVFGIGANGGYLFDNGNKIWNAGAGYVMNLFDFGRTRNLIKIEEENVKIALLSYEKSVLNAINDVEYALIVYSEEEERMKHLKIAANSSQRSSEQTKVLYNNGLTDFQNVLSTERDYLLFKDSLIQSQGLKINGIISLYRAFGGGWQSDEENEENKEKEQEGV